MSRFEPPPFGGDVSTEAAARQDEGDDSGPYVRRVKELISAAQAAYHLDSTPSDNAIGDALDQLDCVGTEAALIEPLQSSIELTQRIIDAISNQVR